MLTKARHTGIIVSNIDKYEKFLTKLGYSKFYDQIEEGLDIRELLNNNESISIKKLRNRFNDVIELLKYSQEDASKKSISYKKRGINHIALTCSDLSEIVKIFIDFGGSLVGNIVEKDVVKLCYVYDFEGNIFELVEEK
jgi:hypothetical protein